MRKSILLSLLALFTCFSVDAVPTDQKWTVDPVAGKPCVLTVGQIGMLQLGDANHLKLPPNSTRIYLGALVETANKARALAIGDFLANHTGLLQTIANEPGLGNISKIFWGGEIKFQNSTQTPNVGRIAAANATAGGIYIRKQMHDRSPLPGVETIELSLPQFEEKIRESFPEIFLSDYIPYPYDSSENGLNHLVVEFAELEKTNPGLRKPDENTRHKLSAILLALRVDLEMGWANLNEIQTNKYIARHRVGLWVLNHFMEKGSDLFKEGEKLIQKSLETRAELPKEECKIASKALIDAVAQLYTATPVDIILLKEPEAPAPKVEVPAAITEEPKESKPE